MIDISELGNLKDAEPLDLDIYRDSQEAQPLPHKGRYTVQAPDSFPATAFKAAKSGYLSAQIDPKIIGPTNEGYTIRFVRVSAKPFKRGGVTVSQLGDYLRATGRRGQVGSDPQAQADAVEQTANQVYQIDADWRAYCTNCGFSIEGEGRFPANGTGEHTPWTVCPNCKDPEDVTFKDEGRDQRQLALRANLVVSRYVAA